MRSEFENSPRMSLQLFARRRDYMMRSERRDGYAQDSFKKKKKRKRAGLFYIFMTLLLSLVLWPVGIIMLWQRKLRWKLTTKLLVSVVSLLLCVALVGFGLTVQTDNPDITRVQDSANDFLDDAAVKISEGYSAICVKGGEVIRSSADLGGALLQYGGFAAADGIDFLNENVSALRDRFIPRDDVPADSEITLPPTDTAEPSAEPTVAPKATPAATDGSAISDGKTAEPTGTAAPTATATATPKPTKVPEPTATPKPVLTDDLIPKSAAEAVVYYNANGRFYHAQETCRNMKGADPHTLAEAAADGMEQCSRCTPPDIAILENEYTVWVDESKVFHLSDECSDFDGQWTLMTPEEALDAGCQPCTTCKAGLFMAACGLSLPTPTPTATPKPTPTPTPTPAPAPATITPSATLKPAGDAIVIHSSNGKWYHTIADCSGMGGGSEYKLSECVKNYKCCNKCGAPAAKLVNEHCLWEDAEGLCHTSDDCAKFVGQYTLVIRDEALKNGLKGCPACGADEYLVPNSVIRYPD